MFSRFSRACCCSGESPKTIEATAVEKSKTIALAEQDRDIAVAEKSREKSEADAAADEARAIAAKAAEQVTSAREIEVAEREKSIELVEARKAAEKEAISVTVAAEAEKSASTDQAESVRILAEAEASKVRITATGEADAEKLKAEAERVRYEVDANGQRAVNEAANTLSPEQIAMQVKLQLIEALPEIIAESVKPIENIDGIKIIQMDGLAPNGHANGNGPDIDPGKAGLADQIVNSALKYRTQAPLLDAMLKEVGLEGGDINGLTQALSDTASNGAAPNTKN